MKRFLPALLFIAISIISLSGCSAGFSAGRQDASETGRFQIVLDGDAVLDRETGLVWEKAPSRDIASWRQSREYCSEQVIGGRKGWRLPTFEELATLQDPARTNPALPPDQPFENIDGSGARRYWTNTDFAGDSALTVGMYSGGTLPATSKRERHYAWCVRSGDGHNGIGGFVRDMGIDPAQ
jgi:hypothetical protein